MDINIHNVGSLTSEQRKTLHRKAAINILSFIMLKVFIAIFLQKLSRSLQKHADKK